MFRCRAAAVLLSIAFAAPALAADGKTHRIAIQVDQNDPQVMNMALNNATNVIEHYRAKNEDVNVEIVAYGPGMHMLRADNLAGAGPHQASQGTRIREDPVLGMQQQQARHGEDRRPCHLHRAGGNHRTFGRGAANGVAGARLELCPALMW